MITLVTAFFLMVGWPLPSRRHVKLPFHRSDLSCDDYDAVIVWLTEKEVKRCVEAFMFYIEGNGEEMLRRDLDHEIGRYEDLMYRFMNGPDRNSRSCVRERNQDRYGLSRQSGREEGR